jgi:hypothetical protein
MGRFTCVAGKAPPDRLSLFVENARRQTATSSNWWINEDEKGRPNALGIDPGSARGYSEVIPAKDADSQARFQMTVWTGPPLFCTRLAFSAYAPFSI